MKKALVLKCSFCKKEFELPKYVNSKKYISCPYCGTYMRLYD